MLSLFGFPKKALVLSLSKDMGASILAIVFVSQMSLHTSAYAQSGVKHDTLQQSLDAAKREQERAHGALDDSDQIDLNLTKVNSSTECSGAYFDMAQESLQSIQQSLKALENQVSLLQQQLHTAKRRAQRQHRHDQTEIERLKRLLQEAEDKVDAQDEQKQKAIMQPQDGAHVLRQAQDERASQPASQVVSLTLEDQDLVDEE